MARQKIKIRLKAYEPAVLDRSAQMIVQTAMRTGALVRGPVPLPTRRSVYTVLRSPHVDKKSREQFEIRIHKRLIEIENATSQTTDFLKKLTLPTPLTAQTLTLVLRLATPLRLAALRACVCTLITRTRGF